MKKTIKKYHLKKEVKDALVDAGIDLLGVIFLLLLFYITLYLL